jgi:integrase
MPKIVKPLSELQVRQAKPTNKSYKLFDGGGLYVEITPNGSKCWRLKYRIDDKERRISLGIYPSVSLAAARAKKDEYKYLVSTGENPVHTKYKPVASNNTIENISKMWFNTHSERFSIHYRKSATIHLNRHIIPSLGVRDINEIEVPDIIALGKAIELTGHLETLTKTLNILSQVFKYAVAIGVTKHNIMRDIDRRSAFKQQPVHNYPVITDSPTLQKLLLSIDSYSSTLTRYALQLGVNVFVRPSNLREAEWSEFDFSKNTWTIPEHKMKMKIKHIVPLSSQAIAILRKLQNITGNGKYLFPNVQNPSKPMSDNTMRKALRTMNFDIVPHSFRGIASTLLYENIRAHGCHADVIERSLAHIERTSVKAAYNHADYTDERIILMQWWSDYLDSARR